MFEDPRSSPRKLTTLPFLCDASMARAMHLKIPNGPASAFDVATGVFPADLLVFRAQVVPAVPIFGYPLGEVLTTSLAVSQVIDLFARSRLPWLLGF